NMRDGRVVSDTQNIAWRTARLDETELDFPAVSAEGGAGPLSTSFALAFKALRRNGIRSALTLLGITIGVGAVLTMAAVGNGARSSIEDQVIAAGMNVITVVAGNYKMKGEDAGGGVADHQAATSIPASQLPPSDSATPAFRHDVVSDEVLLARHPEDDPMEKHNHPTARERLGHEAGA